MAFGDGQLGLAFGAQAESGFNWYTYGTGDHLDEVLAAGYFDRARRRLRPGDLLLVGTEARPAQPWETRPPETRRALLMVAEVPGQGPVRVRLVADLGRPGDPDAPRAADGEQAPAGPRGPRA